MVVEIKHNGEQDLTTHLNVNRRGKYRIVGGVVFNRPFFSSQLKGFALKMLYNKEQRLWHCGTTQ